MGRAWFDGQPVRPPLVPAQQRARGAGEVRQPDLAVRSARHNLPNATTKQKQQNRQKDEHGKQAGSQSGKRAGI